ncbi:MAG: hypothetical protein FWF52_00420 [Candidatus Azobacteroides sp.]|nr:hypothetical protein [Candidatus Azobacteroides sp.]
MKLQDYVGINNADTFCQWLETKTRILGSTKGGSSIKFGIYKKSNEKDNPIQYFEDNGYLWQKKQYGDNKNEVFKNIKQNILKVIQLSKNGRFEEIDNILLPNTLKWKVAFLYSNERLIPIYKDKVLFKIAKYFGFKTKIISEIQNLIIQEKPVNQDVYQYMMELWKKFGSEEDEQEYLILTKKKKRDKRKATSSKNTDAVIKETNNLSIISEQKHNKIQEKLKKKLIKQYGEENVKLEENYVDIKLLQPNSITYFEVKSDSFASDCIKKALGQVLQYSFKDSTSKVKKLCVVGQFKPNNDEKKFIEFIKNNLSIEFEYMNISIEK